MALTAEVEEFMQDPLVVWLQSCLDNSDKLQHYDDLLDGALIQQVLLLIDPEPVHGSIVPNGRNVLIRTRNVCTIVKNIRVLYEEELCQLVVALPDCIKLGREPETKEGLDNMKLLLLLLLGCAVQCPNKHTFIERIKNLSIEYQHKLVHCIQQVTESQEIVLTSENCDKLTTDLLLSHVRRLVKERDYYFQMWLSSLEEKKSDPGSEISQNEDRVTENQSQHFAVEIADWKAKLRKLRQELEEKSEALIESRDELDRNCSVISKLKSEIQELKQEARMGKAYRDEVDALREKAERCERLEAEIGRYKEKLGDLEYYKSRIEELRQENRVLEETREMLEEQLTKARKRADHTLQLESEVLRLKQSLDEITLERDANHEKVQELIEENTQLHLLQKAHHNVNTSLSSINSEENLPSGMIGSSDSSLSEQLNTSVQLKMRKLELENKRLLSTIENLQDSAFHRNNEKLLNLEKEKKKLSLQVEDLENSKKRYSEQLEDVQNTLHTAKNEINELENLNELLQRQIKMKDEELETVYIEKCDLEKRVAELLEDVENSKREETLENIEDLQKQVTTFEKEITKCRQMIEENNVTIDEITESKERLEEQKNVLSRQLDEASSQILRLSELEREVQSLRNQRKMDEETLTTLENSLVNEKLKTQQLQISLDKLGADVGSSVDSNNAKLQVNITTLESQIASLNSQHTALQLANSQLVAEKEDALNELTELKAIHQRLLDDQKALQSLHEVLSAEYESVVKEKEALKNTVRDLRAEKRNLLDQYDHIKFAYKTFEEEKENYTKQSKSLLNLREEHSKLKEDFRNLFTASEKMKSEYRALQDQYSAARLETVRLKLTVTDLQGKLATSNERVSGLEIEITNLNNKYEVLSQVKQNLEEDRRSLMEHVTMLLSQYHELLTHSLEDKEHYHMEEKLFADKVNNLCRQKEKLEEKLMQQYGKMDSCSYKKKGIGARIVRRVKKAGSELIHKRSTHEELSDRYNNTDSDSSTDEPPPRLKSGVLDVDDNLSCLSVPGTRRTVYLSGNENVDADDVSTTSTNDQDDVKSTIGSSSTPHKPPLLVYNRITANVGSHQSPSHEHSPPAAPYQDSAPLPSSRSNANPVWYEYGCV